MSELAFVLWSIPLTILTSKPPTRYTSTKPNFLFQQQHQVSCKVKCLKMTSCWTYHFQDVFHQCLPFSRCSLVTFLKCKSKHFYTRVLCHIHSPRRWKKVLSPCFNGAFIFSEPQITSALTDNVCAVTLVLHYPLNISLHCHYHLSDFFHALAWFRHISMGCKRCTIHGYHEGWSRYD